MNQIASIVDRVYEEDTGDAPATSEPLSRPVTLAELLADPTITNPPEAIFDRIAWKSRTTLFASREKSGKSTLMAYVAAIVSRRASVLILCLEEHPGDVARNLQRFGPNPEKVWLHRYHDGGFERLRDFIEDTGAVLVVIDTLEELVKQLGIVMQAGDDPQWTLVMSAFREIAHETEAALVIVHHANKADGRARGSTRITAGVEAVLEMSVDETTKERRFRSVARWHTEPFSMVLREGENGRPDRFDFPAAEPALDTRILDFVERNPGCSKRDLRDGVKGNNGALDRMMKRLLRTERIENRGSGNGHAYFRAGHGSGTLLGTLGNSDKSETEGTA